MGLSGLVLTRAGQRLQSMRKGQAAASIDLVASINAAEHERDEGLAGSDDE